MAEFEVQIKEENLVFRKSPVLTDKVMHYCPGCSHGTVHNLVAEVIEDLGIQDKTIGVSPVGCSVFAYNYLHIDWSQAAHGRACAVATAIKRTNPDKMVFTYQGDGDLAAIGTAETIHACNRGENIVVIFINNAIYGMTGGQMAPTTLIGQKTTTSPLGRQVDWSGRPIRIAEMLATIDGAKFVERVAVNTPANIRKAKKAIKRCFEIQLEGKGFGIVEVLSACPTNWGYPPAEALKWLEENMIPYYPLGNLRNGEDL